MDGWMNPYYYVRSIMHFVYYVCMHDSTVRVKFLSQLFDHGNCQLPTVAAAAAVTFHMGHFCSVGEHQMSEDHHNNIITRYHLAYIYVHMTAAIVNHTQHVECTILLIV